MATTYKRIRIPMVGVRDWQSSTIGYYNAQKRIGDEWMVLCAYVMRFYWAIPKKQKEIVLIATNKPQTDRDWVAFSLVKGFFLKSIDTLYPNHHVIYHSVRNNIRRLGWQKQFWVKIEYTPQ